MHLYPEIKSSISEFWQAEKWLKEVPIDELSPMWASETRPHTHFYIKELAQLTDRTFVVPQRWIVFKGEVHGEVYQIIYNENVFSVALSTKPPS